MRRVAKFLTSNLGLKILALLLAIVVYYSMKNTTHSTPSSVFLKGPVNDGK